MLDPASIRQALGPVPATLAPPDEFWLALYQGYQTPPRSYHTFDHVVEVVRRYREADEAVGWDHPVEVFLAALFHDLVYRVGAKDNERRSAVQAAEAVARWLDEAAIDVAYLTRLIELTARHGALTPAAVSPEEALFLDCDMAVLGADADTYDRYEEGVAREYQALYPPPLYQQGRAQFLRGLLERERIYLSDYFHGRLDARARGNIERVLAGL
ncbi:HD domain-containing protein [Haliangium sp.]|uniref:HD domain-containing protein n=1 Tax=Haliangium sp. TaxID=2663208 RepID=UPI003D0B07BF